MYKWSTFDRRQVLEVVDESGARSLKVQKTLPVFRTKDDMQGSSAV